MMAGKARIDPYIVETLKRYNIDHNKALWPVERNGQVQAWCMYHKYVEIAAAQGGVNFGKPEIVKISDDLKTVCVLASAWTVTPDGKGQRHEFSFGECSPANNKNAYPVAMAEKRAKDRVTLKLLGLHGFVYSEEEADDFKAQAAANRDAIPVETHRQQPAAATADPTPPPHDPETGEVVENGAGGPSPAMGWALRFEAEIKGYSKIEDVKHSWNKTHVKSRQAAKESDPAAFQYARAAAERRLAELSQKEAA